MNSKINRRKIFAFLAGVPLIGKLASAKPKLAESREILKSFDAQDWARHFVAHAKAIPGLATDEATMTGWFANALMRGYDEREWNLQRQIRDSGHELAAHLDSEAIRGAVARGWCAESTQHKEMDCVLAEAIAREIEALA